MRRRRQRNYARLPAPLRSSPIRVLVLISRRLLCSNYCVSLIFRNVLCCYYPGMKVSGMFALAACILMAGCSGGKIQSPELSVARSGVVFLGDSIFSRWDLNSYFPGKGYVDGGIEGQNTSQILARVPDAISGASVCTGIVGSLKCQTIAPPGTIVIFAGWNNLFQGTDPQKAINDIASMVNLCLSSRVRPIVVTVYHFDPAYTGGSQFNAPADAISQGIRELGANNAISVIDLEQLFVNQSGYTADGVHPIAGGYSQMQSAFAPVVHGPAQSELP